MNLAKSKTRSLQVSQVTFTYRKISNLAQTRGFEELGLGQEKMEIIVIIYLFKVDHPLPSVD